MGVHALQAYHAADEKQPKILKMISAYTVQWFSYLVLTIIAFLFYLLEYTSFNVRILACSNESHCASELCVLFSIQFSLSLFSKMHLEYLFSKT